MTENIDNQTKEIGVIVKISGPVLDVRFEHDANEPKLYDLLATDDGRHMEVSANVAPGIVRCIALDATDGLCCGTEVRATGHAIRVPVGPNVRPRGNCSLLLIMLKKN